MKMFSCFRLFFFMWLFAGLCRQNVVAMEAKHVEAPVARSLFAEFGMPAKEAEALCKDVYQRVHKLLQQKKIGKTKKAKIRLKMRKALSKIYTQVYASYGEVTLVNFVFAVQEILKQEKLGTYSIELATKVLRKLPKQELSVIYDAKEGKRADDGKRFDPIHDLDGLVDNFGAMSLLQLPAPAFPRPDLSRQVSFDGASAPSTPVPSPKARTSGAAMRTPTRPMRSGSAPVTPEGKRPSLRAPSTPSQLLGAGVVAITATTAVTSSPQTASMRTPVGSPKKETKSPHRTPKRRPEDFDCTSTLLKTRIIDNILKLTSVCGHVQDRFIGAFGPLIQRMFTLKGIKQLGSDWQCSELLSMIIFEDRTIIFDFLDRAMNLEKKDAKVADDKIIKWVNIRITTIHDHIAKSPTTTWNSSVVKPSLAKFITQCADNIVHAKVPSRTLMKDLSDLVRDVRLVLLQFESGIELRQAQEFLTYMFDYYAWEKWYSSATWALDCDEESRDELWDIYDCLGEPSGRLMHAPITAKGTPDDLCRVVADIRRCSKDSGESPCPVTYAILQAQACALSQSKIKLGEDEKKEMSAKLKLCGTNMQCADTSFFDQHYAAGLRVLSLLEQNLGVAPDVCCFQNPEALRQHHIFDFILDRDFRDEKDVPSPQGGHFAPADDKKFPYSIYVPAYLINHPRAKAYTILAYEDITGKSEMEIKTALVRHNVDNKDMKAQVRKESTDEGVRVGLWVIKQEAIDRLAKGVYADWKTMFPDCFRADFGGYAKRLLKIAQNLTINGKLTLGKAICGTTALGKITVRLDEARSLDDKTVERVYSFVHQHLVGCGDESCRYSKRRGNITVKMYVREELLSPTNTMTTIMSMHPVL